MLRKIAVCFIVFLTLIPSNSFAANEDKCQSLKPIFGDKVEFDDGVCRVEVARKELKVKHMGHILSPEMMELELNANFQTIGKQTYVMGEFALLENEVQPVVDALRSAGVEVSAIHNHMIGEQPHMIYLHFQGMGDAQKLGTGVKQAMEKTSHSL
ncbi:DUF1259 domain-containing protein [Ectobacillus panaciterrae]|uniref:DUF1259 domain-containing protein n=1 Tax=Ectobacillus panaciterrae TaxID=363872 RepID=UPI000412BD3B|nr:DUF1259 domain-containing protein [Ectobacillus panaciterrae]